ncbi:MAG: hypothetical protein HYU55_02010 [Nocardioides sp.]|nr:hypothetical protein [Nocardioides sp.]
MSLPSDAWRGIQTRRTENPRTILAFYATVIGLLLAAGLGTASAILISDSATYLLPWVLGFCGLMFVMIVGGVFLVSLNDPSKLQLGQVTGEEYAEIQRVALGDSSSGERVTAIVHQAEVDVPIDVPELESGSNEED